MNTPSPLIPQGATPPRGKSSLYFKVLMILGVHVVVIGGMLLQGCRDTTTKDLTSKDTTLAPPPGDATTTAANPSGPGPGDVSIPTTLNTNMSNDVIHPSVAGAPATQPLPTATTLVPQPKPQEPVPAVTTGENKEYIIAKGDTLAAIAKKNGISIKALVDANPGINPKKLQLKQKIQLPAAAIAAAPATGATGAMGAAPAPDAAAAEGSLYTVKSGDMLLRIAKTHGTTVKKIMALNDLKSTSIRAGQKLKLPAARTPATEPVAAPASASAAPMVPAPAMRVSSASSTSAPAVAAN